MGTLAVIADIFYDFTYREAIIDLEIFHLFTYLVNVYLIQFLVSGDDFFIKKFLFKN
ncbi:hypothetical protein [cyanobacterium endosymbiont of Rhopalodia gibberula]|uniref:hypothetical protein n=1 Tax=cyanobacterium endosymbiont of Rhopalodia gibberula TaxID=1763363 RepID=UPI0015598F69|nr:hypothetical protein [cyanobacterium endosymbiont of Rhopalodia gibberula]